jgi:2-iminobutanoate/2-iminopropanoate deaminase
MTLDIVHLPNYDQTINSLFVPAIRVGNLVFLSGVTAAPAYHDHPHRPEDFASIPLDAESQARVAYEAMGKALEAAGSSFDRIVSLTRYFTNLREDQDAVNRVQGEYLKGHLATSATVGVTELAVAGLRVELQAIAAI